MLTAIYYNVVTGDFYDSNGVLRTSNNPFTAVFGEKRVFEWHIVSSSDSGTTLSNWTKAVFEMTPDSASLATDDNYILAYKAKTLSALSGTVTSIECTSSAELASITPTGVLHFTLPDGTGMEIAYTTRTSSGNGYLFTVNQNLGSNIFPAGTEFDIMETPLARSALSATLSNTGNSIFAFEMDFSTWRIRENLFYTNTALLETKGLELRVIHTSGNTMDELLRVQAPFRICAALDSLYNNSIPVGSGAVAEYKQWTNGLFAQGIMAEFSADGSSWSSSVSGAKYVRLAHACAPSGVCTAIPLQNPVEYSFTVSSGNSSASVPIPYSSMGGVSGAFPCHLYTVTDSGSEVEITANSNLHLSFNSSAVVFRWIEAFPAGNYVVRS